MCRSLRAPREATITYQLRFLVAAPESPIVDNAVAVGVIALNLVRHPIELLREG